MLNYCKINIKYIYTTHISITKLTNIYTYHYYSYFVKKNILNAKNTLHDI